MNESNKQKIIVIAGPTASGKTNLARFLAEQCNGEIVSADSRQVYRDLDIGTGKEGELLEKPVDDSKLNHKYPLKRYLGEIPQWLIDIAEPTDRYTVADWQKAAYEVVDDILTRGKLPIIVGGTGLYIAGLIGGYEFNGVNRDKTNSRHADPSTYQKNPPNWEVLQLAFDISRDELYRRIDARLTERIGKGLIKEGEELLAKLGAERLRAFGLEYRYLVHLFTGELSIDVFESRLASAIHQYARRQITWFKKHGPVLNITTQEEALRQVETFIAN